MAFCIGCGKEMGFFKSLISKNAMCQDCQEKRSAQVRDAQQQYRTLLRDMWTGQISIADAKGKILTLKTTPGVASSHRNPITGDVCNDWDTITKEAFSEMAEKALADDVLTKFEEKHLLLIGESPGITTDILNNDCRPLLMRLHVAKVNDGRMPSISPTGMILKKGEVAHLEMSASLMKEEAIREYQGGYAGVSFRVAKGVRFSTGGVRGRMVTVGTRVVVEDAGRLVATSQRALFIGQRRTVEFAYGKLASMEVFEDGVRLGVSNRQKSHLFQLESGPAVAATINAAIQKLL